MKVRPILFNTDMVRAILAGRKTVTRRVTKGIVKFDNDGKYWNTLRKGEWTGPIIKEVMIRQRAPYQLGDILYVRETWGWEPCWDCGLDTEQDKCCCGDETKIFNHKKGEWGCYCYKASMEDGEELSVDTWHPSIHMPKAAARIWLRVTNVRVERLQDIDDDGVVAEGLQIGAPFEELWDSTIKKADLDIYGWDANPWVWVIEFERCEKPEPCILEGRKLGIAIGKFCLGYSVKGKDGELSDMCKKCKKCISAKE